MTYIRISWNDKSATSNCVYNCLYFVIWSGLAGRSAQTCEKWSFFSIFNCLGPFPQVCGQVKWWIMLKLHKVKWLSHIVACPIAFILFYDQGWQGRLFKVMKKWSFISAFSRLGHFPKDFGQVKEWLVLELHKIIRVSNIFFYEWG